MGLYDVACNQRRFHARRAAAQVSVLTDSCRHIAHVFDRLILVRLRRLRSESGMVPVTHVLATKQRRQQHMQVQQQHSYSPVKPRNSLNLM